MELPREVRLVGRHVEVPVAAEVEENDLLLACLLGSIRLTNRRCNAVIGLRRRNDSLGTSEGDPRLEALDLIDRLRRE